MATRQLAFVATVSVFALACKGKAPDAPAAGAPAAAPPAERPAAPVAAAFDSTFELNGIRFRVQATNQGSGNQLTITPSGLEGDNSAMTQEIQGTVTGAEVADLNADQSPEIYVYVQSAGSGSYGSVVAYGANKRKSLSQVYVPPISENAEAAKGYMGHDEFAVVEGTLVQRFPVYKETDTNANPTGGMRQVQWKLKQGEAGWVMVADRVVSY
jgi:hypothetical protein